VTLRIAMWSGPRNLSTALMYAFAARPDCAVWDEPFYAAYLAATGIDHPLREAVIAGGLADPAAVSRRCAGPAPDGRPLFYQKHMTLHVIDGFPLDFMAACVNVFLIRHPARVVASYAARRENPTPADLGFARQAALFDREAERLGHVPPVIDSADIRADPAAALTRLCARIGIPFTEAMLSWPAGPKPYDGVWAPHWYGAVHRSTGFEPPEDGLPVLPPAYRALAEAGLPAYEALRAHAL
jgi:hypothetical protein